MVKGKLLCPFPGQPGPAATSQTVRSQVSKISLSQRPLRAFSGVGTVSEHLFSVHSAFLLCESLLCEVGTLDKRTLSGCVFPPQWFFSFVYCRERSWPVMLAHTYSPSAWNCLSSGWLAILVVRAWCTSSLGRKQKWRWTVAVKTQGSQQGDRSQSLSPSLPSRPPGSSLCAM